MNSHTTPIWTMHAAKRALERNLDPALVEQVAADAIRAGLQGKIVRFGLVVVVRAGRIKTCAKIKRRWRPSRTEHNRRVRARRRRRAG